MVILPSAAVPRRPLTITPASVILICVAALLSIGLAVLFSASSPIKGGPYAYLYKQFIFLALSIGAGWLVAIADLEQLRRFAWVAATVVLIGLVLVLFTTPISGGCRWRELVTGPSRGARAERSVVGGSFHNKKRRLSCVW